MYGEGGGRAGDERRGGPRPESGGGGARPRRTGLEDARGVGGSGPGRAPDETAWGQSPFFRGSREWGHAVPEDLSGQERGISQSQGVDLRPRQFFPGGPGP